MLLPPVYLLVRTLESGSAGLEVLFSTRTLGILLRTMLLVGIVTPACAVIGVSLAWLTLRTDLPFPPRVRDAHRAAARHPQLRLRPARHHRARPEGHGAGLARTVRRRPPAVHLRPARRGVHPRLPLVPVRHAAGQGRAPPRGPGDGGGRAQPRQDSGGRVPARHSPPDPPRDRRRFAARRAVHPERLRRGLAAALPDVHLGHLHPVRDRVRPQHRSRALAGADGARHRAPHRGEPHEGQRRLPPRHARRAAHAPHREPRTLAVARRALRGSRRLPLARGADGAPRLLGGARA